MKKRLKEIFIITVLFIINYCQSESKFQIIGGQETTITQFPHQCAFLYNNKLKCGCSVISNNCFLTAAHCTYQYNTNISVRVGSTFKEKGGKTYDIVKIINYPLFDILKLNYDYALLIPDREILFDYVNGTVRPVKLSEQNQVMVDDTICTVSGWGKADNDTRPDKLRFVDVKVVNQTVCQACYNTPKVRFKITDFMMCAGYMEGGRDACSGDSGGPLICNVNNITIQAGVVSSGYGCAVKNFPGIYADPGKVRNWISDYCNLI